MEKNVVRSEKMEGAFDSSPRGISHYHAGGHQRHVFKRRIRERHPLDLR